MARKKSWYDPTVAARPDVVRVVRTNGPLLYGSARRRRLRTAPGLLECFTYPLTDGPGVGLIVFLSPILLLMSLPVFDVVALLEPLSRGSWALGLLALPVFLPLILSFSMVFGYALLFLGQMFVASALGEPDHPRWPDWDSHQIAEGLTRWAWAAVFGLLVGGLPVFLYWMVCGDIDWFDRIVFADLVILAVGYTLMALAAALLHDSLAQAHPVTVVGAIFGIGWDFVFPCVSGGLALMLLAALAYSIFGVIPSLKVAVLTLGGFWAFFLYASMVVLRIVGLTYHAHADELAWFQGRPKWGTPSRFGKIYNNS